MRPTDSRIAAILIREALLSILISLYTIELSKIAINGKLSA